MLPKMKGFLPLISAELCLVLVAGAENEDAHPEGLMPKKEGAEQSPKDLEKAAMDADEEKKIEDIKLEAIKKVGLTFA